MLTGLKERIKRNIFFAEKHGFELSEKSWGLKDGILISVNEAKELLEESSQDKERIEELEKHYSDAVQIGKDLKAMNEELTAEVDRLRGLVADAWHQSLLNCEYENGVGEYGEGYISWIKYKEKHNL